MSIVTTAAPPDPMTELLSSLGCPFEYNVPLGPLTWYGVGGTAELVAHPQTTDQIAQVVRACHEHQAPVRVLGKGANLLVCEGVIDGIVLRLDALRGVTIDPAGGRVTAGGGADLEKLITATVREGLEGLENLAGIPATVGGALRMNAGGAFGSIGPLVDSVTVVDPEGVVVTLTRDQLLFSYRRSNLGDRIVAAATFALRLSTDRAALRERLKAVMKYKKDSQPMAAASAGCAFKNPPKEISERGAGKLIDDAGLKGFRLGGAEVSPVHANFIVLHPGGRAGDVLAVMQHVEETVARKFNIHLEREVVVWK